GEVRRPVAAPRLVRRRGVCRGVPRAVRDAGLAPGSITLLNVVRVGAALDFLRARLKDRLAEALHVAADARSHAMCEYRAVDDFFVFDHPDHLARARQAQTRATVAIAGGMDGHGVFPGVLVEFLPLPARLDTGNVEHQLLGAETDG